MANITGRNSIDDTEYLEVDGDPSAAAGTPAPPGSIATVTDGSGLWRKSGGADTAWTLFGGGGGDVAKVGMPVNNQVGVWTGDGTLEGTNALLFDGSNFLTYQIDQNSFTYLDIINETDGAAARTGFRVRGETTSKSIVCERFNDSFTLGAGFELFPGDSTAIYSESTVTNGLRLIAIGASAPLILGQGGYATANERLRIGSSEVVFNEQAQDIDHRFEGVGQANALFVQGSNGFVGVGTAAPTAPLHVKGGGASAPALKLEHDRGSADDTLLQFTRDSDVDGDVARFFSFVEAGGGTSYVAIKAVVVDNTPGTIDGDLVFSTAANDVLTDRMRITNEGAVWINEITTPTDPAANFGALYFKSGNLYQKFGAVETQVGGLAAGADSDYVPYIQTVAAETATFAAVLGETHVVDTSAGGFTANLPAVATAQGRISFYFAGQGAALTVDPNAAETIGGKSTLKLYRGHNTIENDGTEWKLVQRSGKPNSRLDPAQITANQDGYNPTDWGADVTHLYLDSDAARTISGFEENGFVDTDQVVIVNDGAQDIVIANDAATVVADRVLVDGGSDFTLAPNKAALLMRDGTVNKWRLYAMSAGSGDVSKVGTPADNELGVWTGNGTLEGESALTYDGVNLILADNANQTTGINIRNSTSDTAAAAAIAVGDVLGNEYLIAGYYSPGYTANTLIADRAVLQSSSGASGIHMEASAGDIQVLAGGGATTNERLRIGSTAVVFNDQSQDVDHQFKAVGQANALFVRGSDGSVGVGTDAPNGVFHIAGTSSVPLTAQRSVTGSGGASLQIRRSRNTVAAPAALIANDFVGGVFATPYNGSTPGWRSDTASVRFRINGTPGGTNNPATQIEFYTCKDAATAGERVGIFEPGGRLQLNSGTYDNNIHQLIYSGNVGGGSEGGYVQYANATTGTTATDGVLVGIDAGENFVINQQEAEDIILSTSGSEAMRILSGGNVGIGEANPSSTLDVDGSFAAAIETVAGNDTLDDTNHFFVSDTDGAARTINLPAASTCAGRGYHIRNNGTSGNDVTVDANAAETINGALTHVLSDGQSAHFVCDGSEWFTF